MMAGYVHYIAESVLRIERRVDMFEKQSQERWDDIRTKMVQYQNDTQQKLGTIEAMSQQNCRETDRKLDVMKAKQDQIQATLHGESAHSHTPPVFTTPPFLSPTSTVRTFPQTAPPLKTPTAGCISNVMSAINDSDLKSLLSAISWDPPDISLKPQADLQAGSSLNLTQVSGLEHVQASQQ